ncbi:MAG: hypothetical protein QM811_24340 [Pirellulales bacterium]
MLAEKPMLKHRKIVAIVCATAFAIGIYFLAFHRINQDLVWTDVKRILVLENVDDLKELCDKIHELDVPNSSKVEYQNISTNNVDDFYRGISESDELKSEASREAFFRRRGYIKPEFTPKDVVKIYLTSAKYPTIWENFVHIYNDRAAIVIYLNPNDRIVGWELSEKINMTP